MLQVRRLSSFFSTTTPTPSRRRVVIFSTTTQGIRLRRRVDVFSTTSDTNSRTSVVGLFQWLKLVSRDQQLGCRVVTSLPRRLKIIAAHCVVRTSSPPWSFSAYLNYYCYKRVGLTLTAISILHYRLNYIIGDNRITLSVVITLSVPITLSVVTPVLAWYCTKTLEWRPLTILLKSSVGGELFLLKGSKPDKSSTGNPNLNLFKSGSFWKCIAIRCSHWVNHLKHLSVCFHLCDIFVTHLSAELIK